MRRLAVASVLWLCALSSATRAGTAPVIGGHVADNKKWPDAVAVFFGNQQGCTGILLAPTLVITAAHCNDPRDPPTAVLIGANNLTRPQEGEMIAAKTVTSYPNWDNGGADIALIVLDHASTIAPRTIATGWAAADIQNGTELTIVGWGATDSQASVYPDDQMEAVIPITDADCTGSEAASCTTEIAPGGEFGGGGMGIDTCPGDSGGPAYLVTSYGTFLAGTTDRGYNNAASYCEDGGIYERPDKFIDWIETTSGLTLPRGPMPSADTLMAETAKPGHTTVDPKDPKASADHTFAIAAPPTHGTATVDANGVVTYTSEAGYLGDDSVRVTVSDSTNAKRAVTIPVAISVVAMLPDDGCSCASGGSSSGALAPLAAFGFVMTRRRRRRA
ncbi:MAG: trypsin-like serine protease [Deltaproteobacteria bacterium]|nr:trypsin-like serine protease [Deltaproteobacteria bacterium]